MSKQSPSSATDLFLYDTDQLTAISSDENIRQGLAWFKSNSVHSLSHEEDALYGVVEDLEYDKDCQDIHCNLSHTDEGNLSVSCDCHELDSEVCSHAIALLYAYATKAEGEEFVGAVDNAIAMRAKRGRNEVNVEQLEGKPWFGRWKASSITSSLAFPRSYRVDIRSLQTRSNVCDCQDFAVNQLGTCKHIEAVLHKISRRDDYKKIKAESAPTSYVYLSWEVANPPQLVLYQTAEINPQLASLLEHYFNASGAFSGQLPDDFFRLNAQVRDRDDLHLGEDAISHVQHLSTQASQQQQTQKIRQQIEASGGHLPGIKAKLYPYQIEGVAFLAANGRGLLADDMGLGKTLQSVAAASWLMSNAGVERSLIICPASLKQQWAREIEKFTEHSAYIIQGTPETRGVQYNQGSGFYIINYELVLRDLSVIQSKLSPDLLILDEAQRIKNWRTKIASTIKQIPAQYAFVLSGTPLENRLEDLFSLMQVVDTHVLGPLWRYLIDFHITDEHGKVLAYRNLAELRRRLEPVMLRRDRRIVSGQLPKRINQQIDIELTPAQKELHGDALSTAGRLATIAKRRPLTPSEQNRMMAALQTARMACNAAGLVDKETQGSPKLDEMETLVNELCMQSGQKAVIFSQWKLMTDMVELRLRKMGVGFVHLHGGIPTSRRGKLMDSFREDDAIQVFISTDAGGVGLNLQSASVVINLDMPWNPAILDQRIARVHRLGQKNIVQSILIIAADSYEQHVASLVSGKRDLFDNVVDPEGSEDTVGVSKKLLETLAKDLEQIEEKSSAPGHATPNAELEESEEAVEPALASGAELANDQSAFEQQDNQIAEALQIAIASIQSEFGTAVEQIFGSGGGLLVVMPQVSAAQYEQASQLSTDQVPIALIDAQTLGGLQRLGEHSPIQSTESYYNAADEKPAKPPESPLIKTAKEQLQAAEVLLEQDLYGVASKLLINAQLNAIAGNAALDKAPSSEAAGVWVYTEALSNGWVDQEQANRIMRNLAVAQADEFPTALLEELLGDVRECINPSALTSL